MTTADSSGTHLYLVLMKAHRTMARHAHRSIAAHDLGFSDFTILEALLHKGPMLVNEIGRRIELTSGSITTAVDRLEARGLVERSADADDRRAKQVSLTRSGRTLGFEPVGTYRGIGFKHGHWHDVAWTQRTLADGPDPPPEPT